MSHTQVLTKETITDERKIVSETRSCIYLECGSIIGTDVKAE